MKHTIATVFRTAARGSNLTVILLGAGLSVVLTYALATELFAKNSPTVLYGDACDRIKSSEDVSLVLILLTSCSRLPDCPVTSYKLTSLALYLSTRPHLPSSQPGIVTVTPNLTSPLTRTARSIFYCISGSPLPISQTPKPHRRHGVNGSPLNGRWIGTWRG